MNPKPPLGGSNMRSPGQRKLAARKFAKEHAKLHPVDLNSERLTAAVREAAKLTRPKNDEAGFFIGAGEYAVLECLRLPFDSPQAQDFFQRPPSKFMTWEYTSRLFSVADALFSLKDCDGFEVFCAKAREKDLRSVVSEMHAARMFSEAGFSIKAIVEQGKRKSDFDFRASKDGHHISVEVTAFTAPTYSSKTVTNALRHKRKQVPDDAPAAIFAVVPESWHVQADLNAVLRNDAISLFDGTAAFPGTRAINAVIFLNQHYKLLAENPRRGRLTFEFSTHFNSQPRHPSDPLMSLVDGTLDRHPDRNTVRGAKADIFLLSTAHQTSRFFDWARSFWNEEANAR